VLAELRHQMRRRRATVTPALSPQIMDRERTAVHKHNAETALVEVGRAADAVAAFWALDRTDTSSACSSLSQYSWTATIPPWGWSTIAVRHGVGPVPLKFAEVALDKFANDARARQPKPRCEIRIAHPRLAIEVCQTMSGDQSVAQAPHSR
jgi:hypothetical protein